jgi:glycine cleavage system H protein
VGEPETIELPEEGDDFTKGDIVLLIEGSKGKLEVTAPASGTVGSVNSEAAESPTMVSEDPLEEGWLIKLEIQDKTDLQDL